MPEHDYKLSMFAQPAFTAHTSVQWHYMSSGMFLCACNLEFESSVYRRRATNLCCCFLTCKWRTAKRDLSIHYCSKGVVGLAIAQGHALELCSAGTEKNGCYNCFCQFSSAKQSQRLALLWPFGCQDPDLSISFFFPPRTLSSEFV